MRQNKRYSVDAYVTMTINTDKLYVYADSIEEAETIARYKLEQNEIYTNKETTINTIRNQYGVGIGLPHGRLDVAQSIEGDWTLQSIRNLDEDERKDFR